MTTPAALPIVVGVDESDISAEAVRWAAQEAQRRHLPVKLVRADEWIPGQPMLGNGEDAVREHSSRLIATAAQSVREQSEEIQVTTALSPISTAATLVEESREASMVVVGSRGHGGFSGLLLGSTSLTLVAHAHCPVIVLPTAWLQRESHTRRIVVGVDNSPAAEAAVAFAMEEASTRGAELAAIHSWSIDQFVTSWAPVPVAIDWTAVIAAERATFSKSMTTWRARYPDVEVVLHLEQGHPRKVLAEASTDADLVVVGARGRGAITGLLLGSVSQSLLHESSCPVAVVPHRMDNERRQVQVAPRSVPRRP